MGHMLGSSCNSCCTDQGPCPCLEGQLPDTVTVTLSGPQGTKEQGPPLLPLRFAACFGSGAEGFATAPGGVPEEDIGPISDATVTDGGSGYAKLGRVAPTLTITGGSGEGATFTPTLESTNDDCGVPTWKIDSVTATGGTGGYQNGDSLSVSVAEGEFEVTGASLTLNVSKSEPVVEAAVSTGTGAQLEVFLAGDETSGWIVSFVSVIDPGSGYEDQEVVVFTILGDGIEAQQAEAEIGTNQDGEIVFVSVLNVGEYYIENLSVSVQRGGKYYAEDASISPYVASVSVSVLQGWPGNIGSGATFTATVDSDTASETFGQITSVAVTNGGSGYLGWRWIYSCDCDWIYGEEPPQDHTVVAWRDLRSFDGDPCSYLAPRCYPAEDSVTSNAWIRTGPFALIRAVVTSDLVPFATASIEGPEGKPGRDNGPIVAVGAMQDEQPLRGYAVLGEGGAVIQADVTVQVEQFLPSQGSGAEISYSINTDPDDEDFGLLSLTIANAGDGYLGGYTGADFVIVTYPGPNSPPTVESNRNASPIGTLGGCQTTLTADAPITNCDEFSFEATFGDQTATVSPGGEVAPPFEGSNKCCHKCFVFCPEMPDQVVATFTREANEGYSMRVADNVVADGLPATWGVPNFETIAPQGAYYATCPEHEVEVVWDVDDLHNENRCSVDFCGELPEEESCETVASISEETRLFFGAYALSPGGFIYGFGVVPDDQIGPGEFPSHFGGEIFDASPESMTLDVAIEFISADYNQDPHEGIVRVVAISRWFGNGHNGDGGGAKTNTYTKPSELACGSVPGEWDENEEIAGGSVGQGYAQELGEEYGLERREWEADVDDYYHSVAIESGGGFSAARLILQRRRICKNYELTVDFQ
jgi:hypothetical protein